MGLVFEALDIVLDRKVALKVLRPGLPAEQAAKARFLREARAMAALSHTHIVSIFQVGEDSGLPYLAMPLLHGETLEALMQKVPRPPLREVARVGAEIADGLAAAHAKGLIHRDIKPSNVWLEAPTGRVKLLDFGLARETDEAVALTNSGFVIGTPAYMSPEQARGEDIDFRSDLFSLGTVLYQMATHVKPFDGPTAVAVLRHLEMHTPQRISIKRPDCPPAFANLVMELLAKDRDQRPATAEVVVRRLQAIDFSKLSRVPLAPTGGAPACRPARRRSTPCPRVPRCLRSPPPRPRPPRGRCRSRPRLPDRRRSAKRLPCRPPGVRPRPALPPAGSTRDADASPRTRSGSRPAPPAGLDVSGPGPRHRLHRLLHPRRSRHHHRAEELRRDARRGGQVRRSCCGRGRGVL